MMNMKSASRVTTTCTTKSVALKNLESLFLPPRIFEFVSVRHTLGSWSARRSVSAKLPPKNWSGVQ